MKGIKKLWAEFKKFICRGNVLDLAVAVIIGAAFTAIVTSLTNDIIMPLINSAVGDGDLSSLYTVLKAVYTTDADGNKILDTVNSVIINWGSFIQAILNFLLVAIVIFAIIKIINSVHGAGNKLNEITNREKKIRKYTKKYLKQGISKEEAKLQAERLLAAENISQKEESKKPTVEQLLTEIRDLLSRNNI